MTALNPLFLWLLPLAMLPVLFHLFFRVRKRTHPFSTLMFFIKADPKLSARKRIREWLALFLRALAILLLLLALARPVWMGAGSGGAVGVVLVVDNSASMSARGLDGPSGLGRAVAAGAGLLAELGSGDVASIALLVDDPAVTLPPPWSNDPGEVRAALDRILPTEAAGSPGRMLERVAAWINASPMARHEVHILSDLQSHEWGREGRAPTSWRPGTVLQAHRLELPTPTRGNVFLRQPDKRRRRLLAGRRLVFGLDAVNDSAIDTAVRLHTIDDSGERSTRDLPVAAFESWAVAVPLQPASAGTHWLSAWLEEDGFAPDNRAFAVFRCEERETVLFLGEPGQFGMLPLGLAPDGDGTLTGLVPRFTTATGVAEALEETPALIVATGSGLAQAEAAQAALQVAVRQGAVLLVLPGVADVTVPDPLPEWVGATFRPPEANRAGLPMIVYEKDVPLWEDLKTAEGELLMGRPKAHRFFPLEPADGAVALLGLEDGRALLTQRPLGGGIVLVCGSAMDPAWNTLPLHAAFLPLLHGMALLRPSADTPVATVPAGLPVPEIAAMKGPVKITAVTGDVLDWAGAPADFPGFPRAGVYSVTAGEDRLHIAVQPARGEAGRDTVTGDAVPAMGSLRHRSAPFRDVEALMRVVRRERSGVDLLLPLLLLSLLAVLLEGWIVNPPQHGQRGAAFRARTWLAHGMSRARRLYGGRTA